MQAARSGPGRPETGGEYDGRGPATGDALRLFVRDISRFTLLTPAEESDLAKRAERGDREARERLVTANLRLVIAVARRYQGSGLSLLDLIQEGSIGLMRAADRFDWRRGYRFSTYATWWIHHAVRRAIANRGRAIRLPVNLAERTRRVMRAEQHLADRLGRPPLDAEVAAETGLTVPQVRRVHESPQAVTSLDRPVSDENGETVGGLVPDETPDPEELVIGELRRQALEFVLPGALASLPEREREIVTLRYGIGGAEPRTLAEIGRRFGLTRERIRQIERHALDRLSRRSDLRTLRESL